MVTWDIREVQFVTASPGSRGAAERITLPLDDGRPPKLLTDPSPDHPGDWRLIEQGESDGLVYQLLARETAHP